MLKKIITPVITIIILALAIIAIAEDMHFEADITDVKGVKSKVTAVQVYWETRHRIPYTSGYRTVEHTETSLPIIIGEASLKVNFVNIKKIETATEKEQQKAVRVTLLSGKVLDGYLEKDKSIVGKIEGIVDYKISLDKVEVITFTTK